MFGLVSPRPWQQIRERWRSFGRLWKSRLSYLNYRLGFNVLLGHLTRLKSTAQFLSAATLLDLHEDRFAEAWENLLALNRIVARFKDEPLMISELVRLALGNIALNTSWEALQSTQWQDRQLQELQVIWESVDYFAQAELALSMERAM